MSKKQNCGTCKWAEWEQVSTHNPPRPLKYSKGYCCHPRPELPLLPLSMSHQLHFHVIYPTICNCAFWKGKS